MSYNILLLINFIPNDMNFIMKILWMIFNIYKIKIILGLIISPKFMVIQMVERYMLLIKSLKILLLNGR